MSPFWDLVTVPDVLVLRGANSDILSAENVAKMKEGRPGFVEIVVPDCGHAPMLMTESQILPLAEFLTK